MSKEEEMMEKLVEEIATVLHGFWARTLEDRTTTGLIDLENEHAKNIITRIGKAYAEGELMLTKVPPKLPDEIGRIEGVLAEEIIQHFFPGKEGDILIALSPTRRG